MKSVPLSLFLRAFVAVLICADPRHPRFLCVLPIWTLGFWYCFGFRASYFEFLLVCVLCALCGHFVSIRGYSWWIPFVPQWLCGHESILQNKPNFKMGNINISTARTRAYAKRQRTMSNERYSKQSQSKPISNAKRACSACRTRNDRSDKGNGEGGENRMSNIEHRILNGEVPAGD